MINYKEHWDQVYLKTDVDKLGWYEETPLLSMEYIKKCNLEKDDVILDVGSGMTTLIESLCREGYSNIIATDISDVALNLARERLGDDGKEGIRWVVDDITCPQSLMEIGEIDLWHDRTVLHFLVDEDQQKGYLNTLKKLVKYGGYVIIALFSLEGAKKCSGLDVKNYDHRMISDLLGSDFKLLDHIPHLYKMPSGDSRPYIYTRFQKQK